MSEASAAPGRTPHNTERSPRRGMCAAVLCLEAITVGLTTPVLITIADVPVGRALLIGVGLNLLQAAQPISEIPAIAESLGTFESPLRLPVWLNVTLGVGAALGATERAMRMRYHWLLDGGAGT